MPDFAGFAAQEFALGEATIFARVGGAGPPLLLLHGFPQSHAMWAPVAARLAQRFTVVAPDLRGYGASSAPESRGGERYSKRVMAKDFFGRTSQREVGGESGIGLRSRRLHRQSSGEAAQA